jgi:hypothetical protein
MHAFEIYRHSTQPALSLLPPVLCNIGNLTGSAKVCDITSQSDRPQLRSAASLSASKGAVGDPVGSFRDLASYRTDVVEEDWLLSFLPPLAGDDSPPAKRKDPSSIARTSRSAATESAGLQTTVAAPDPSSVIQIGIFASVPSRCAIVR